MEAFPDYLDVSALLEDNCIFCGRHYFVFPDSDEDLCHDCMWFLEETKPRNEQEERLEEVIRGMSDEELRDAGMGRFFEIPDVAAPPLPQPPAEASTNTTSSTYQITVPPALSADQQARSSPILPSSMYQTTAVPPSPQPQPARSPAKTSSSMYQYAAPLPPPPAQRSRSRSPTKGPTGMYDAQMAALNSQLMHEKRMLNGGTLPPMPTFNKPLANTSMPAYQQHSRRASEIGDEVLRSPSVQAQDRKRRGLRMICATCKKEAPVSSKNDGMNCTRCFNKLQKSHATLPGSSKGKRDYDDAFDGYSPWDVTPSKMPRWG